MLASVTDYDQLTDIEHVLKRPDMYVGSYALQERDDTLAIQDEQGNTRLQYCHFQVSDAVERLFLEVLTNASDNVIRSREKGLTEQEVGGIDVQMTYDTVTVRNYGIPIILDIHPKFNMRLPKIIFTLLRSGSNYGDNVSGAGKYGLGAKLTAVHSTTFTVTVASGYQKKFYRQSWHNNLSYEEPELFQDYDGPSYVEVQYTLDFQKLGYQNLQYTDMDYALIHKHVIDASLTSKITTSFNGITYDFRDIKKYVSLLTNVDPKANSVVHILPSHNPNTSMQEYKKNYWKHTNNLPSVELCIIETPDNPATLAYTNGIPNRYGGVHVEKAIESTSDIMIKKINTMFEKISGKGILNKKDLRKHITCVIIVRVLNPVFDSQSKTALKSPKPIIKFTEDEEAKFGKFNLLFKRLLAEVEGKALNALKKTDGKRTRHTNVEECEDANFAGTKESHKCVLMLTEGKSASGYATVALEHVPGKRNYFGTFPLRGKPINTMNADIMSIVKNQVITDLKEVLGLREGTDYTVDSNYLTLRYGKILIMADADEDGKHIIGLLLNLFHSLYPSLIAREYIMILRTPIVRVTKGKERLGFFTHKDYEHWMSITPNHGKWVHKYLKGLASSTPEEISYDFQDPRYVQIVYDDVSDQFINLAFNEKMSNLRKEWIATLKESLYVETWSVLPISQFIDQELVTFARDNLGRNIPRLMDGLKESQRKILWGMYTYKTWGSCGRYENGKRKIGKSDINTDAKSIKVGALASHVQESTAYKHGEQCLCNTIIGMAFNFTGSNNIEYFRQDGLFGSRNKIGEDAGSPRYIFCAPSDMLHTVFKFDDFVLMDFEVDEGEDQEPKQFLPVIPMILVNGANGIGSGYSTRIPKFNPLDLSMYLKNRLNGIKNQPEPIPWYRDFKGTITATEINLKNNQGGIEVEMEVENENGEIETIITTINTGVKYKIAGSYHIRGNTIHITELPIDTSMSNYKKFLEQLVKDKKADDYKNHCGTNTVHFELIGYKGTPNEKDLRLVKTLSTSNMIILDENDIPKRYSRINDILEDFYTQRLAYYHKRKQYLIDEEIKIVTELQEKDRFITDLIEKNIVIEKRTKEDIKKQLQDRQYKEDIYKTLSLDCTSDNKVRKLKEKLQYHIDRYNMLCNLQPEQMWYSDIEQFEAEYKKYYKF